MSALIRCTGISKRYGKTRRAHRKRLTRIYLEDLIGLKRSWREDSEHETWVLRDINLEIQRGQAIGVLGDNGAGKSTLMSIISHRVIPDAGVCETHGDIAVLSNLTAGFKPELSGRENIALYASLRGKPASLVRQYEKEIIEFSELGEKIDAPFFTYSQGMKLRLGFSITCCMTPDVIIIDETLGVGDRTFRKKCLLKLRELRDQTAIIVASHNAGTIRSFCDQAIVLHAGHIAFSGPAEDALSFFEEIKTPQLPAPVTAAADEEERFVSTCDVSVQPELNVNADKTATDETIHLHVSFDLEKAVDELTIKFFLYDATDTPLAAIKPKKSLHDCSAGRYEFDAMIEHHQLCRGEYRVAVMLKTDKDITHRSNKIPFNLGENQANRGWGVIKLKCAWD